MTRHPTGNQVDDLDVLFANVLDANPAPTHDEIANVLLGIKQLYDMKFYTLMSTYEKYLKEQHNEKTNYCGSITVDL